MGRGQYQMSSDENLDNDEEDQVGQNEERDWSTTLKKLGVLKTSLEIVRIVVSLAKDVL